jgi:hypothetical protein
MDVIPTYTRDELPDGAWCEYRKVSTTKMIRLPGRFKVQTREGVITCEDGFLAMDSGGWPYPIAADEHDRIYEPVLMDDESNLGRGVVQGHTM